MALIWAPPICWSRPRVPAQSREEILADKVLALAMRRGQLKNRDLWDLVWLHQQAVTLDTDLVVAKLQDRSIQPETFLANLQKRITYINTDNEAAARFTGEMERFVPTDLVEKRVRNEAFWQFLQGHITSLAATMARALDASSTVNKFAM